MQMLTHEWIENFEEYEAVLRCLNPLSAWDKEATVRAFQTFEWNHASAPGGELEFAHQNTPVVVRYDGEVLAILFGLGKLNDAVPDLFAVLNSLGWRMAEVYHPVASLSGLLSDFGKAIPANMDFDVKPAKSEQKISDFAEVPLLIAQAKTAMKGVKEGGANANDIILQEMLSMDRPPAAVPAMPPSSHAFATMVLEDDFNDVDASGSGEVVVVAAVDNLLSSPSMTRPEVRHVVGFTNPHPAKTDSDDDAPRVFSGFGMSAPAGDSGIDTLDDGAGRSTTNADDEHTQTQAGLLIENERLREALSTAEQRLLVVDKEVISLTQARQESANLAKVVSDRHELATEQLSVAWLENTTALKRSKLAADKNAAESAQSNSALVLENERLQSLVDGTPNGPANSGIKVGMSAFCFDIPTAPFSDDDEARVTELYGIQEIAHLYPGAIGGSVRWDVLAEIDLQYPWYAEKLAEAMGFRVAESVQVCKLLLDLKQAQPLAQLRDLLKDASPDAAIGQVLAPLSLAPLGQAFVDLPTDLNGDGLDIDVLTVRGVLQSSSARLFVVHVDALDGPFVGWMVELLRFVVQGHAVSKRHSQAIRVDDGQARKSKAIGSAQAKMAGEVSVVVDELIARLEKMRELPCV